MLLLLFGGLLFAAACSHQPPAPPPDPGKIITQRAHSLYYFDFKYTVGRIGEHLRVVGTISNTIPTDLNNFMVTLTVRKASGSEETERKNKGKVLAKVSTPFFDVEDMEQSTFVLDLPLLHGPCLFSFHCDYLHFDDMAEGRRGRFSGGRSEWNYFDDRINLP